VQKRINIGKYRAICDRCYTFTDGFGSGFGSDQYALRQLIVRADEHEEIFVLVFSKIIVHSLRRCHQSNTTDF
jgi:hypothetical protein